MQDEIKYIILFLMERAKAPVHTYDFILDPNGNRVIKSPEYPKNYPDNSDYTWILNTGDRKANVTFSVLDVNISKT